MTARKAKRREAAPRARKTRSRQRQRLIDACISALHLFGPSRTTVEKVVAIAKMSPGIVRFYFESKAAMLVASLQFLAAEFEEQLLIPVADLKSTPVAALERMVDLYLDPEIASPRKVSVWYAFWGEASSRQEYYDICGQKDESFAALVRDLIGRLIVDSGQAHLDRDGIALGLIGALEILWQDFAFRAEEDIDRAAAKQRCMAYLRSVFPGQFRAMNRPAAVAASAADRGAAWAYCSDAAFAMERERVFREAWAVAGHVCRLTRPGDYLTIDTTAERVLLIRAAGGALHALRNSCPAAPHRLVAGSSGRLESRIDCRLHGLEFRSDGVARGGGHGSLVQLDLCVIGGLILVRSAAARPDAARYSVDAWNQIRLPAGWSAPAGPLEIVVHANWKIVVEQWLAAVPASARPDAEAGPHSVRDAEHETRWILTVPVRDGWSAHRYASLLEDGPESVFRRLFIAPNQLVEFRPDGVSVLEAVPVAPARTVVRRFEGTVLADPRRARAAAYLARRLGVERRTRDSAESIHKGLATFGYDYPDPVTAPGVAWFRALHAGLLPALARHAPPVDNRN